MAIIPQRIKSERKRLGYTQQQIADICEISRIQWGRLERGDSVLGGRVLKAFVTAGANLNYLLTGEDSQTELMGQIMFEMALSKEEHKIVLLYRELTIEQKNLISETMKLLKNS
nr:hypothetical protein [Moraxella osloensis]